METLKRLSIMEMPSCRKQERSIQIDGKIIGFIEGDALEYYSYTYSIIWDSLLEL